MSHSTTSTKKKSQASASLQTQEQESPQKTSFLSKLFLILENQDVNQIISWSPEGDKFQIINSLKFQNDVIPMYFKHKNLKSFIRQLNLHGFKKLRTKSKSREANHDFYKHNFFRRDQPDLINLIRRKVAKPVENDEKTDQITYLIEKQKELQNQLDKFLHDSSELSLPPQKVIVQQADSSEDSLVASALNCYRVQQLGQGPLDTSEQQIAQLTKDFLANLNQLKQAKPSDGLSVDHQTAPSINGEDTHSVTCSDGPSLGKRDCWDYNSSDSEQLPTFQPSACFCLGEQGTQLFDESFINFDSTAQVPLSAGLEVADWTAASELYQY